MRFTEITQGFDPLLVEFWSGKSPEKLKAYATRGGCGEAAADFLAFLEDKGIMNAEIIPTGYISGGKKKKGWFRSDVPDSDQDAFTREDVIRMRYQDLNFRKKRDRLAYIKNNGLEEEFSMIPHAWVEIRDRILDPSGFMPNGEGQFDKLVRSGEMIQDRYQYFK